MAAEARVRILVAFDGSAGAVAALEVAARLTRSHADGGQVVAMSVLNPLVDATDIVAPTAAEAVTEAERREWERLAGVIESTAGLDGVKVELVVEELTRGEDVPTHLVRAAREREVDLIAIASRRASGVKGLVLGSVTQHTLRLSDVPVLVVRPPAR